MSLLGATRALGSSIIDGSYLEPSVPIPKFASPCGAFSCELRNQRDTSKLLTLVWFLDLKFLNPPHEVDCARRRSLVYRLMRAAQSLRCASRAPRKCALLEAGGGRWYNLVQRLEAGAIMVY